ncbi:MAG: cupin domain-containing protein, partial [Clostridium sp.]|nr:cupin domain-containing protein [Clostridium sp.]
MKGSFVVLTCAVLLAALTLFVTPLNAGESTAKIRIIRGGTQPTRKGDPAHYTGSVLLDHPFQADEPGRHGGEYVSYEPSARSAWHTNPAGERVMVMSGKLLVQEMDGPVEEVLPGQVVWFPPNLKHWHGAAPDMAAKTLSFREHVNGLTETWLEKVSDAEYAAREAGKQSQFIEISVPSADSSGQAPATRFTGT